MSERLTQRTELGTAVFNNVDIGNIAKKLCDLEDKIEQGKLVELPCRVGDKTYLLLEKLKGGYDILVSKCVEISENENGKWFSMYFDCVDIGNSIEFQSDDFGETVFLDRAAAEAKLREMEVERE